MCQGPEAAPCLAGVRNSRRQGWLEGRVGEMNEVGMGSKGQVA